MGSTREILGVSILLLAGCGDDLLCTSEDFQTALAEGGTLEVGACPIAGDFTIDRAIVIRGRGASSRLRGSLTVETDGRVELIDVAISSPRRVALIARGGQLVLTNVEITTELGAGVALEDATAELTNVSITGSVDVDAPPAIPIDFDLDFASTHGLVAVGGNLVLTDVRIRGTAIAAALFARASVTWTRGRISDSLGIGILGEEGSVMLDAVEIDRVLQGFDLRPAYGAVFTGVGSFSTGSVRIARTQGIGLAQIGSGGVHVDLEADANTVAGVWIERGDVELSGRVHDNTFAGMVAVETGRIDVHDAAIDGTRKSVRQVELLGRIEVGDGIQVVRPSVETNLSGVTMTGNERTGLLLDLPAQHGTIDLSDVEVTVTTTGAGGAVAQGSPPADWDDGVRRNGTDAAADRALAGKLDVLQVIAPCDRPRAIGLDRLQDLGF